MSRFTVALLQFKPCESLNESLEVGLEKCKVAKAFGADLALFPEMWSNGYRLPGPELSVEDWKRTAITQESDYFQAFVSCARDNQITIGLTYLEKCQDDQFRNTISIIDMTGEVILTYAKVHTCSFSDENILTPGDGFKVCDLKFSEGSIKLGTMICYDREFPESARVLMLKGAEVILVPNACEMELNRAAQLRARAFENMTGIALANYPGRDCKGNSMAFDGIAFKDATEEKDGKSRDMLIKQTPNEETMLLVTFDLNQLRHYRQTENWGPKHRHPEHYKLIIES